MAFETQHSLKQVQNLKLSPQMRDALNILQMPILELAARLEEELINNPLLERARPSQDNQDHKRGQDHKKGQDEPLEDLVLHENSASAKAQDALDAPAEALNADMGPLQKALLSSEERGAQQKSGGENQNYDTVFEGAAGLRSEETLFDVLHEQLALAALEPVEHLIGYHLIGQTDERGYFCGDTALVAQHLGVSHSRVEAVLGIMQAFEPSGVMACNLKECLRIQLKEKGRLTPAMASLVENLESLAKADFKHLRALCKVSQSDLDAMIAALKTLHPKPGSLYDNRPIAFMEPDVFVRKKLPTGWSVRLNTAVLPKLLVNEVYEAEVKATWTKDEDKTFISTYRQKARWLIKSLDQRARTLLGLAREIVRQQSAFLDNGVEFLKPMILEDLARAVNIHVSTVSRALSGKYMATSRGVFEMKYFLTQGLAQKTGTLSSEAIRETIKKILEAETVGQILSDRALVEALHQKGIKIDAVQPMKENPTPRDIL